MIVATTTADNGSAALGGLIFLGFWALLIVIAIFGVKRARAEAAAHEAYLDKLFPDEETRALFHSMYDSRKKSVATTYLLSVILSPTIAYVYLGEWGMAVISFLTLQGLAVWWILGVFVSWSWAIQHNKRIETEVINQIKLARPTLAAKPA